MRSPTLQTVAWPLVVLSWPSCGDDTALTKEGLLGWGVSAILMSLKPGLIFGGYVEPFY